MAYAGLPLADVQPVRRGHRELLDERSTAATPFLRSTPSSVLSTYDTHFDGSGVRYASRLRPVLNVAPKTPLWSFNPDTHILGWLEHCGIEYDVVTARTAAKAQPCCSGTARCLTGTHPEYYTTPMWERSPRSYIAQGGHLA